MKKWKLKLVAKLLKGIIDWDRFNPLNEMDVHISHSKTEGTATMIHQGTGVEVLSFAIEVNEETTEHEAVGKAVAMLNLSLVQLIALSLMGIPTVNYYCFRTQKWVINKEYDDNLKKEMGV